MLLFSCFSFKSRLIHIFSMILVSGSSLRIVPLNFSSLSFSSLIMMFTWYERLIKSMNSCNGLLVKRYLLERQSYSLISIFVRTTDLAWVLYTIRSFGYIGSSRCPSSAWNLMEPVNKVISDSMCPALMLNSVPVTSIRDSRK